MRKDEGKVSAASCTTRRVAEQSLAGLSSRGMLLVPGHLNHCWKCCKDLLKSANSKLPPLLPEQGSSRAGMARPSRVSKQHPLISAGSWRTSLPQWVVPVGLGPCGAARGNWKNSSQDSPGHAVPDLCCCRPSYGILARFSVSEKT